MSATDVTRAEADVEDGADAKDGADAEGGAYAKELAGAEDGAVAAPKPRPREWTIRRLAVMLAPAMLYLAIRELGLLVLTWMGAANGYTVSYALRAWDGQWFLAIADGGYDNVFDLYQLYDARGFPAGATSMAFFPGYPLVIRGLAGAGSSGGIGLVTAALTVTILCGVICAYGLARLGRQVRGGSRRAGLVLVALFAASPMAVVLSMTYSEAMFCAFAVWSLVGVLERRWLLAGVCCGFAGLVRPTAAALILAVGLAVLVALIQRREGWWPAIAGVLAPVGLVGYLAWVASRTGSWDGWFVLQHRGWGSGFDGGVATWHFALEALTRSREWFDIATVALIVGALVLVVIAFARRLEWPLLVYGIGVLAMDLASSGLMNSKARLMVPAFTLLIPVAIALARRRTVPLIGVLGLIAVASSWFGAYALTTWSYAI